MNAKRQTRNDKRPFQVSGFAILVLLTLPLAAQADDWVMGFHDSRHTGQTSEVVAPPLTVAWTWKDTNSYDNDPKWWGRMPAFWLPLFYKGKLYFQGGLNANRLFCFNPADGSQIWETDNPGYTAAGTYLFQFDNYPAAAAGRIVNASTDFTMTMDAATGGDVKNSYNTNGGWPGGGGAAWHDMAYFHYVETDDYSENFNIVQDPGAWVFGGVHAFADNVTTFADFSRPFNVPAVDAYRAYSGFLGTLEAFDALSARTLWSWGSRNFGSSPAISNGIVYFYASSQNQIVALDAAQGSVQWSIPISGAYSPIVSDGVLYVGSSDRNFYARDAATGAPKWSFSTGAAFTSLQVPAISGNRIYVPGADGILYVLDKTTGAKVWQYNGTAAWGPVVIGGGMIFASDLAGTLYGFRPAGAAIGPAESAISKTRIANNPAVSITLTGGGFFAGGASSAVQTIHLDDPAQTVLSGSATSDQSITVTIPAGIMPGTYHIKVQTTVGQTVNEPSLEIEPANSNFISTIGTSGGTGGGTQTSFQRHLARTSNGTLVALYAGPPAGGGSTEQDLTYNISRDAGMTWTMQTQLTSQNFDPVFVYAPTSSVWVDAQDRLNLSFIKPYRQSFEKFAVNSTDLLSRISILPTTPPQSDSGLPGPLFSEPGGRLWVAYASREEPYPSPWHIWAAFSDDGGLTWTRTAQINPSPGGSPPALVMFQGKPVVLYSQSGVDQGGALVWAAWNGSQWNAPQVLPGPITGADGFLSAVVTSNNQVHVAYAAAGGVQYVRYDGNSWSAPKILDAGGTAPSLTTNGSDLWCFYVNAAKNLVYQRTTGGQFDQWNSALAITNDGNQNTAPSTLNVSPDATIPVLWTSGSGTATSIKSALVPSSPVVGNNPQIGLSVPLLAFNATAGGGNPASQTLSVTNTGTGTLSWTPVKTQNWLTVVPGGGGNGPTQITVTLDIRGLAAGSYSDTIRFTGNASNNPQVSVTLNVAPAVDTSPSKITVPPTITLTSPLDAAAFTAPATIPMASAVASGANAIAKVEYYQGTTLLDAEASNPYSFSWTKVGAGTYQIRAVVTDAQGLSNPSNIVTITVNAVPSPLPQPPPAISLPSFTLNNLDGKTYGLNDEIRFSYPVSGVTFAWSFAELGAGARGPSAEYDRVSGPGTGGSALALATTSAPKFAPANAGLTPGTYRLTVTASQTGSPSQSANATITLASTNINTVKVYPNPWRADKHAAHPYITFDGLAVGSTIKLFTISGHAVKELHTDGPTLAWDLTNDSGDKVASGVYLYLVTDRQRDMVRGKLAVIK